MIDLDALTELAYRENKLLRENQSLGEIHVADKFEIARLKDENAALRKALDDRRTVEGWVFGRLPENRRFTVTAFDPAEGVGHRCEITLWEDGIDIYGEFAETANEAFAAAAEWVRGQG